MTSIIKNFSRISAGLGFYFFASLLGSPNHAAANGCPTNPSLADFTNGSSCFLTPDVYKVTFYEMGLCTSDPLASTTFQDNGNYASDYVIDESSCSASFINENGVTLDLASGGSQTLSGGTNLKPPTGSYGHAYVKIKNVFGLKGSYTVAGTPYYSKSVIQNGVFNGVSDTDEANYSEWEEKIVDFDKGSACEPVESNRLMAVSETFNTGVTGTLKALLASVSGGSYSGTTQANCGDSTRIFGVFSPTSPVVISEQTKGLEVSFTITERGISVFPGNNPYIVEFGSGPFTPKFQTF